MAFPNIVIAGAPKCGTTSLYRYFSDHPEVCTSQFSETRYLIDKDKPFYNPERNFHSQGLDGYRQLFQPTDPDRQKIIVDVTPDYLYQQTPLKVLPEISPVPILIFILRDPSLRIYSLYQFARNNIGLISKKLSFKLFIQMIEASSEKNKDRFILYDECEKSKYIKYLKNYLEVFGLDKIIICIFEELKLNPQKFMTDLCRRLRIEADFFQTYPFKIYNRGYQVRNQNLHKIRRKLRNKIPTKAMSAVLSKIYNRLNISHGAHELTEEEIQVINKLNSSFRQFNDELANTFKVDLKLWQNWPHSH